MRTSLMTLLAAAVLAHGCADGRDAEPVADPVADRTSQSAPASGAARDGVSWQERLEADLARLGRERPELVAELEALRPSTTRAGHLRFTTPLIHDADAAPVLLDRLLRTGDAAVRAALAEALPRTGGAFAAALPDLLADESSPEVRAVLVAIAWRVPAEVAARVVEAGLGDGAAPVRAEAARTAGRIGDRARPEGALVAALGDPDAATRAAAAEALGVHRSGAAAEALASLLADDDADVRLAALRALRRAAPVALAAGDAARALAGDPDPRVRRLAARIAEDAR